jgi:thioredoxin 1
MKRVVYFTASWCGPCKAFRPILQQVTSELEITVEYVDVDANPEKTQEFGVSSVPTMFVYNDNTILFRQSGAMSKDQLKSKLS